MNSKRFMRAMVLPVAIALLSGCAAYERRTAERSPGRMVDDRKITHNVKNDLSAEPVYKFNDVEVNTFNGTVQLSGFVNSEEQKRRAGEIAQAVPGVARVENHISLKAEQPLSPTGRPSSANPAPSGQPQ